MSDTITTRQATILLVCGAAILALVATLLITISGPGGQAPVTVENDKSSNETLIQDKRTLIQDKRGLVIEANLREILQFYGGHSILIATSEGRFKWLNSQGHEVPICGHATNEAKDFRAVCGLKTVSFDKQSQITFTQVTRNPPCVVGNVDGGLRLVHSTKGPPGKWKEGQWDCHDASAGSHDG